MDHFKGINETERFNNDLLNEIRETNQLLKQLISLIKPQNVVQIAPKVVKKRTTKSNTQKRKVQ